MVEVLEMKQRPQKDFLPAKAILYYQDHPAHFVRDMILQTTKNGMDVTPEQDKFLQSVLDIKFGRRLDEKGKRKFGVTMHTGHGVGKTTGLAMLILTWLTLFPSSKIPVTSSKKEQLADNLWPEMAKLLQKSLLRDVIEWQKTKIFWRGAEETQFAVARTGSTQEALQGFHDPHLLFIVEEASGVENSIFEPVEGALTNEGAVMVLAGNPVRSSGYFYDSFTSDTRFDKHHVSCVLSDGTPHQLVSEDYAPRMKSRYGEESNIYRVRVLGLPPKSDDDTVIPFERVHEATQMDLPENRVYRPVWGVDVARFGSDYTCVVKRRGPKVIEKPLAWNGLDNVQVASAIMREIMDTQPEDRPTEIFVDDIGVGGGVYDILIHAGQPATAINVGRTAFDVKRFGYLRDELWWRAREWFETSAVSIPDVDEEGENVLVAELSCTKYYYASNGKICIEPKKEQKKRLGWSPDRADALVLTFASHTDMALEAIQDIYAIEDEYGDNDKITWAGAW